MPFIDNLPPLYLFIFSNNPYSMNNTWNISKNGKNNVNPKMLADANLEENS
jgi:hypothetical protein